jgi:hypothetical protein
MENPKFCWHCSKEILAGLVTWQARRLGTEKWYDLNLHADCAKWFDVKQEVA